MSVELRWVDPGVPEFTETDALPDGRDVFATWPQAKQAALDAAIDNRELWAACARRLRVLSRKQALES